MKQPKIKFGFQLAQADVAGASDASLMRSMLDDAVLFYSLGYDTAWVLEHHFSDYHPQPSPFAMLAHIAALCPGIGLGTMVLVTPWHQPVRLAGEIALLSQLSQGPLHLGLGRGAAPLEYEAFGIPMPEAKQRFEDTWRIIERAMQGGPFSYQGKILSVAREIEIRPRPVTERINFYGAIGNPASATKIADLGLSPISNGTLPFSVQRDTLKAWRERMTGNGLPTDEYKPVAPIMMIADTDAKADALARKYLPRWFEMQVEHYAFDAARHHDIPDYRPFAETHKRRIHMTNPDNLDPLIEVSLVGSPETVREKLEEYIDIGFDAFILSTAMPGIPPALRAEWMTRFAHEIAPPYAPHFGQRPDNPLAAE